MKSRQHPEFVEAFKKLDAIRQKRARKALEQWKVDPSIRGLGWHMLKGMNVPLYSMHVGFYDRAIAMVLKDENGQAAATWLWIGSHEEYNGMVEKYKPRSVDTWTQTKSWASVASIDDVAKRLEQQKDRAEKKSHHPNPKTKVLFNGPA